LQCDYCYLSAGSGQPGVPVESAIALAEYLGSNGLMEVRLTGGEPLSHPRFFDIFDAFRRTDVYVSIATNGLIQRATLDRLVNEKNYWVICSLDGSRDVHNVSRPGTFDIIVNNLTYLKRNNPAVRLRLTAVLTKHNRNDMGNLCRIGAEIGAEDLTVIPLRPQVRKAPALSAMVTAEEFQAVIEDLLAAQERYGIRVTTTLETQYSGRVHKDPVLRKRSSCAAGREATNIDFDGSSEEFVVYGCSYSPAADFTAPEALRQPFTAGRFRANDLHRFQTIWENDSNWIVFRDLSLRFKGCSTCSYWLEGKCVGSCPIQNVDYRTLDADDILIEQLRRQLQSTAEWYCYQNIIQES